MKIPAFYNISIPAPRRLAMMRAQHGGAWKERRYGLHKVAACYAAFSPSADGTYYSHTGPEFRGERFADECDCAPSHKGWYTNADGTSFKDGSGLARGIVGRLPHGRFIAGYHWGDNGERVYYPETFADETEAARAADRHAERWAEIAREDSERFDAMTKAEGHAEAVEYDVRMAFEARNVSDAHREHARERIEELRAARADVVAATAAYEKGE